MIHLLLFGHPFSFDVEFPCNLLHRYLFPTLGHLVNQRIIFVIRAFAFGEILWLIDTIDTLKIPIFKINPFT